MFADYIPKGDSRQVFLDLFNNRNILFTLYKMCVCVCVCTYIHTYKHTYIHTHTHTYMMPTCFRACLVRESFLEEDHSIQRMNRS